MTEEKSNLDVKLPIKKTTGETLEDRMTENAYERILPARYLRKNEEGELVESQEEVFERVAKNVSLADALYEAERRNEEIVVTPTQVKDNHSKREKLVEKAFGKRLSPEEAEDQGLETNLTEENIKYFSYDNVKHSLSDEVQEHVEKVKDNFQEQMEYLKFMPNTPTIIGAGDELQMLAACFVMSPEDDMDHIHETARRAAKTFQGGGGVGYGFWQLRPKGDTVGSTGGVSSGPISFMRTYDQVCSTIAQGGSRRGAQMGVMRVSHPDVLEFIHAKNKDVSLAHQLLLNDPDDTEHTSFKEALEEAREILEDYGGVPKHLRNAVEGHLSNFNISVGITDDFMEAVYNNEEFTFTNPKTEEDFIANEKTVEMYEMFGLGDYVEEGEVLSVPAEKLWKKILEGSHENGEPGVVFLERMNKQSSFNHEEHPEKRIKSTNPCGEEPLFEFDACNLSHINLSTIVDEDCGVQDFRKFREEYEGDDVVGDFLEQVVDWEDLDDRVHWNTRFLDNVVTMCDYPIPEIEETTRKSRKIGLGIMGYAQMLVQIGVKYGSDEGDEIARRLMNYINDEAVQNSKKLAVSDEPGMDRGKFEDWNKSKWSEPIEYEDWFENEYTRSSAEDWEDGFPMRNHTTTTIAPTGTTSQLGNTSGGCEPIFSVARFKNVSQDIQGEDMLVQFDDLFLRVLDENDIDVDEVKEEAKEQMDNNEFAGIDGLETVPNEVGELFVTTSQLSAMKHASVQCAFQEGVSSAISKTINAPNDADLEDTREAFEYIYDNGGKGVTYYRDGSRSKQVLTTRRANKEFADEGDLLEAVRDMVASEGEEFVDDLVGLLRDLEDEEEFVLGELVEGLDGEISEVDSSEEVGFSESKLGLSEYRKRPDNLVGATVRVSTGYGTLYVTLNEDGEGELFEVFAEIGKSGGLKSSFTEGISRMVSMALRYGVPPERIVKHLSGIKSAKTNWDDGDTVHSVPDGMALAMERYLNAGGVVGLLQEQRGNIGVDSGKKDEDKVSREFEQDEEDCPDCGGDLVMEEGCETCHDCGYSKC